MIRTQKSKIKEIYKRDLKRLSVINSSNFSTINDVRLWIKKRISKILESDNLDKELKTIKYLIITRYILMFKRIKSLILNDYNISRLEQMYLAETGLGKNIEWKKFNKLKDFPNTKQFQITNKILSEKSVSIRSKKMAERVTNIIEKSVSKGYGIEKTTRLLDIEFGYRNKDGKINDKMLKLIKQGRVTHTNGHFYTTYRIARTEIMRMSAIASDDVYNEVKEEIPETRLQLLSYIDSRTREQSAMMNGQISNEEGKFKYPDGRYYKLGFAPARWSINDRETTIVVFLKDKKGDETYKNFDEFDNSLKVY